jgi:Ca-activated chloride channel homolog
MKNLKAFSLAISMLICFVTMAQDRTITGVVSDNQGTLPGANVVVKGTKRGVQTDYDGKYSIHANTGEILVFSFIGLNDKEIKVGTSNVINVILNQSSVKLEEVVVMGYSSNYEDEHDNYRGKSVVDKKAKPLGTYAKRMSYSQSVQSQSVAYSVNTNKVNKVVIRGTKSLTKEQKEKIKLDSNQIKPADITPVKDQYEDYEAFIENVFESPRTSPLSTFSIDVDNASYTNIRRFINNGQKVPKDAVRIEEMMNFFKYQYPQPQNEHPFSINSEYSNCPWNTNNKLVRIGLQGKNIENENLPASNLVFLIDVSGSMDQANKLPLVVQSLKVLVSQLRKEDKVAIVVYAGAAGLVLPPTSGDKKMTIIDALDKLKAGGSTAGGQGIMLAYKTAEENFIKNGNNRVVLATDGDFNVGASSDNDMQRLIEDKRKSGVFLTCLGFGMGNYKDSKMEVLANKGNGNYAYIDTIQEANRFLGKEFKGSMFAIAKDVKIQIEFNPNLVQAYRLIGYENRKLRPEDFKNDAIDAGELGSGHTVTALYEIVPRNTKCDYFDEPTDLKYTVIAEPSDKNYKAELATIKFRYKKPDDDTSIEMINTIANTSTVLANASSDFKFCASVAWFGLNLRDSKLVKNKSLNDIKILAKLGLSDDTEGYKSEFIRLIDGGNLLVSNEK